MEFYSSVQQLILKKEPFAVFPLSADEPQSDNSSSIFLFKNPKIIYLIGLNKIESARFVF